MEKYASQTLGGSRGGWFATALATAIALLLSGLWHGASWNFVPWGAYHTVLILLYRSLGPRIPAVAKGFFGARWVAVGIMYGFTCLGWLIFREMRVDRLWSYTTAGMGSHEQWVATIVLLSLCLVCAVVLWARHLVVRAVDRIEASPWYLPVQTTGWAVLCIAIFVLVRVEARDFIYFRF